MEDRIQEKTTPVNEELNNHLQKLKKEIRSYKRLDANVQKVQERLKLVTKVASIGVWDWDIKMDQTIWDDKMFEIYGIEPQQPMTHNIWMKLVHPDDLPAVQDSIKRSLENQNHDQIEFRIIVPNKTIRYISAAAEVVKDNNNNIVRVVGVNKDITERKMAEEALKKSERKLRIANTAKDKFFSILAHDLLSPFNSVLGFSKLLSLSCEDEDFEKIKEYSNSINSAANQTYDLLTNLLEWSRSQRGKIQFQPDVINLNEIINRVLVLYSYALDEKEIFIENHIPLNFSLAVDSNMINTVFRNLISNAIKFTGVEGIIKISVTQKINESEFCISDSGTGISKTDLENIFNPELNFSTNGTNLEGGTGLGLIICKDFIERHGGKMWIESKENIGTDVYFTIPLNV